MTQIHMPQDFKKVFIKALTIGLESFIVPSLIMVGLTQAGHTMWALWAILAWNAIFFTARWRINRAIPVTSMLMATILVLRTALGVALGHMVTTEMGLQAYLLPACILSGVLGIGLIVSSTQRKPLMARILKDFLEISEDHIKTLLPMFKGITLVVGLVYFVSAVTGGFIVLSFPETEIALWTSALSVSTPITAGLGSLTYGLLHLYRRGIKLSVKPQIPTPVG